MAGGSSARAPDPAGRSGAAPDVSFPTVARLELDQLLEQLVERAQDVLATQGRLRGLLGATRAVTADLSLPVLLRRIAEAATQLVGARYGALGVVGPDGQLSEFLPVGVEPSLLHEIGRYPHGAGILGLLIADPRPLRLTELSEHSSSVGFPAGHPPMHTFLGVPIVVRDEVFGNLYLCEKDGSGAFTSDDEELLMALASAAGVAIDNARLYDAARRRQHWLEVSAEIVGELVAGEVDPLPLIAARARQAAGADLASLLVPDPDDPGLLRVAAADGSGDSALRGRRVARDGSLAGRALAEDRDLVVDVDEASTEAHEGAGVPTGPAVLVRVRGTGEASTGVLSLSRWTGARPFDRDERDMVATFAGHAGIALELARAQRARRELALVEDRTRIARDLHDRVIQRLFATGLGIDSLVARTADEATRERLGGFTEDLDGAIRAIRQIIFQLQPPPGAASGLRHQAVAAVRELTPALGFSPDLRMSGPLDTLGDPGTGEHAVAVLREALTNVARHAGARRVEVVLAVDADALTVRVADDGVGLGRPERESGLAHMRTRAVELGGRCTVVSPTTAEGRGTSVEWVVPLEP